VHRSPNSNSVLVNLAPKPRTVIRWRVGGAIFSSSQVSTVICWGPECEERSRESKALGVQIHPTRALVHIGNHGHWRYESNMRLNEKEKEEGGQHYDTPCHGVRRRPWGKSRLGSSQLSAVMQHGEATSFAIVRTRRGFGKPIYTSGLLCLTGFDEL
jgi:hypothetical protein